MEDTAICDENRRLFRKFLDFEEYKLKRTNQVVQVDARSVKTLMGYLTKLANANRWFGNKPFKKLTKSDIRRVYDALEDGEILNVRGKRFAARIDYYDKIFRGKPFELAGKATLAQEVIQFATPHVSAVRFLLEPAVRDIVGYCIKKKHRLLVWLAFDIGENVNTLLDLRAQHFTRQLNKSSAEPEYRVQLPSELLKRSRTSRSEVTLYRETVVLLDELLPTLKPDGRIFSYGYAAARKFLTRASVSAGVRTEPNGDIVNWKDLRSGMACDLLRKGWTADEVNARLGHRPSSRKIDRYVNFLALNRDQPKVKVQQFEMLNLQAQLEESRNRERLHAQRLLAMEERMQAMHNQLTNSLLARRPRLDDVEEVISLKSLRADD